MFKAAFFCSFCIPIYFKYFFVNGSAFNILNPYTVFSNGSDFAIAHDKGTTGVVDDCRNIGSNKVFTFTQANNQGVIFFGADDFVLLCFTHKHQGVRAFDNLQNFFNGAFHIAVKKICHQVSNNFGVSIRRELYAFSNQFFFQRQIVFDNTVVYYNKFTAAISMRMAVTVRRTTVGCPTSVTNTDNTFRHVTFQFLTQRIQTTNAFFNTHLTFFQYSNTCGVVTAVFKLAHTIKQEGSSLFGTDITNDTTH